MVSISYFERHRRLSLAQVGSIQILRPDRRHRRIGIMGDSNFFKGTSTDQDRRFADKESKLLKTLKFPPEFEQKVSATA
jgi:hypothetical protein